MKVKFILPLIALLPIFSSFKKADGSSNDNQDKHVVPKRNNVGHERKVNFKDNPPNIRVFVGNLNQGDHVYVSLVPYVGGTRLTQQFALASNGNAAFDLEPGSTYFLEIIVETGEVFYSNEISVPSRLYFKQHTLAKNYEGKIEITNWTGSF